MKRSLAFLCLLATCLVPATPVKALANSISFKDWEATATLLISSFAEAEKSENGVVIDEAMAMTETRILAVLHEGIEIDGWIGEIGAFINLDENTPSAYCAGVTFYSKQREATLRCLAVNWDPASNTQTMPKRALSTFRPGDVVRVHGRIRWLTKSFLYGVKNVRADRNMPGIGKGIPFDPTAEKRVIGDGAIAISLTSLELVTVPPPVKVAAERWDQSLKGFKELEKAYGQIESMCDLVSARNVECITWVKWAKEDTMLVGALQRRSPICLEERFKVPEFKPEPGSSDPYDLYKAPKPDHSGATYTSYVFRTSDVKKFQDEDNPVRNSLGLWWVEDYFEKANEVIIRAESFLSDEMARARTAVADLELMKGYAIDR